MARIEGASVLPLASQQSLIDCPPDAGPIIDPTFRLYGAGYGNLLLTGAVCWGLAPLLVIGLLLAREAVRLVQDSLGMAGPGGAP